MGCGEQPCDVPPALGQLRHDEGTEAPLGVFRAHARSVARANRMAEAPLEASIDLDVASTERYE